MPGSLSGNSPHVQEARKRYLGTARSGMMLSQVTPALQEKADSLRAKLEEVALLRGLQEGAERTLSEGLAGVQQARTALSQAVSERSELPPSPASWASGNCSVVTAGTAGATSGGSSRTAISRLG